MSDNVDPVVDLEVVTVIESVGVSETVVSVDVVTASDIEVVAEQSTLQEVMEAFGTELLAETVQSVDVILESGRGPPGPVGPSEDSIVYAKRVDFVSTTTIYRAEAAVGSNEAAAAWRIRRFTFAPDGDVTEQWANGSAEFVHVWADRATYTYQ